MPTVAVFDMTGKKTGEMELNAAVFGIEPNMTVVHAAVKNYLANQRQGTQSTLTRAEVRGGGIKPWRQKGTGRARQGSIRSPQWTHGGIALGPKPRSYNYSLTKKTKRLAMLSALSAKAAAGEIIVIDGLDMGEIKTKNFVGFLNAIEATGKSLVVTPEVRVSTRQQLRSCRRYTHNEVRIRHYQEAGYHRAFHDGCTGQQVHLRGCC